jgi:uncharacterized protein
MQNNINPKAVLDSGILVSAFLAKTETQLSAALFVRCAELEMLVTAEEILTETRRTLLEKAHIRRRYTYLDEEVEAFIALVRSASTVVEKLPSLRVVERDPKDDMIIACAVTADADYIVSRDRDLLDLEEYQGIAIVSPEAFMPILRELMP